jgi:hypothetical protein
MPIQRREKQASWPRLGQKCDNNRKGSFPPFLISAHLRLPLRIGAKACFASPHAGQARGGDSLGLLRRLEHVIWARFSLPWAKGAAKPLHRSGGEGWISLARHQSGPLARNWVTQAFLVLGSSTNEVTASRMAAQTTQESATLKDGQGWKGGKPKSNFRKSTT